MKTAPTDQKLRGGYYTPLPIAHFLAKWAVRSAQDRILEPSCGDGNILAAAASAIIARGAAPSDVGALLTGVELDRGEAAKSFERMCAMGVEPTARTVVNDDFGNFALRAVEIDELDRMAGSEWNIQSPFDAVLGNPPFIRYQSFPEEFREPAFRLMRKAGLNPNKLTNAWAPFLVASAKLLGKDGRLAMVIPAELFQVNYAAEVRQFLSDEFRRINIVTFKRLVFEDIQQEVVLLLAEKGGAGQEGIRSIEVTDLASLQGLDADLQDQLKPLDHSSDKWTQYFLEQEEILLLRRLREHPGVMPLGTVLDVDVGVVTGENKFFVLKDSQMKKWALHGSTLPIVTKSPQMSGIRFDMEDMSKLVAADAPVHLLSPSGVEDLDESLRNYIAHGEEMGFNQGYKCRIRKKWYIPPSSWVPDAFVLRQVHAFPRIVANCTTATCTDTVHRARLLPGAPPVERLATGFINSMTLAFSEVTGRSYGGGVLTFEPSESECLPMPLSGYEDVNATKVDALIRAGEVDRALALNDEVLLAGGMALSTSEIWMLTSIWKKMRDRRMARRSR